MAQYRWLLTSFSLLLIFWVTSLASANTTQPDVPPLLAQLPPAQTQPDPPLEVMIADEGIFPPVLFIPVGATISWTNQTGQPQRLEGAESGSLLIYLPLLFKPNSGQAEDALPDDSPATGNLLAQPITWNSGDIPPTDSFSFTFDQPGKYPYLLSGSPNITGTIMVQTEEQTDFGIAAILAVTTQNDDNTINGNCTLREAIIAANSNQAVDACPAGSSTDMIALGSGTYSLTLPGVNEDKAATGDLDVTSKITLTGAGDTIIDAAGLGDRIFHVGDWGRLTLSDLSLRNGSGFGGGIYNRGTLTLNHVTISNSIGGPNIGGGFKNDGQATLNGSAISGNTADFAAGIYNRGILALNNSTVSGNTAATQGGGIKNEGTLALNHTTIAGNTARFAGGLRQHSGAVTFKNSIIAGNTVTEYPEAADCDNLDSGSLGYNLVGDNTGCPTLDTDLTVNPANVFTTALGSLQDNDGATQTHALLVGSPAIDAVPLDQCGFEVDQRDVPRPQGAACDSGSFELSLIGPIFIVNTTDDPGDGACTAAHCSLREAIIAANARPNNATPDEIRFNIPPGGPQTIQPTTALPTITEAVKIEGSTQPGFAAAPIITLDGTLAGLAINGLDIAANNSTVRKLIIRNFSGAGVRVTSGVGNIITENLIFDNGQLGLDLDGDSVTPNDIGLTPTFDPDTGANNRQNFPVLTGAFPDGSSTRFEGRLNSAANTLFTLEFFATPTCDLSGFGQGQTFLGSAPVTTDASGDAIFLDVSFALALPLGRFVSATATGPDGTSEFAQCIPVSLDNDTWPRAYTLNNSGDAFSASFEQFVDKEGQSRWFKFKVQPNSQVIVTMTGLPENYDLTLYKDIQVAFDALTNPDAQDLIQLNAEFAGDAFAADAVARGSRSPDALARGSRSPDEFAAGAFSPDAIARGSRSPDDFARGSRSPDVFAPDAFSPDAYTPDALARGSRSPDEIARGSRSPEAFSSAQTRSLIGISAFEGTASEGILVNTWNNTGDFYVRVKGRNGAFSLAAPFQLEVELVTGACNGVSASNLPPTSLGATSGNYQTIILTDLARMEGTSAEKTALQAQLAAFAARPEVAGVVVNVGADARVAEANKQADGLPPYNSTNITCPYAKNLVAGAIKTLVDRYRAQNPLQYVVIVGNDEVVPFFRYPDRALLGPESDFVPPLFSSTPSEASLRLDYVLGQDEYGSQVNLSLSVSTLPIPDLAVGRLVETATDATRMLNAYLVTGSGVVSTPTSALVTGYDFFADAAEEIQTQLEAGLGLPAGSADSLITGRDVPPEDGWTAEQLADELLTSRHDIVFLGGHFSASSALAADYETRLRSIDLTASTVNLENALIFSIGCHSGYNIVNSHGILGITAEPDWAQAFARKGATFIGGTGYQYGDTDFLEYSERIYLEFSRQLRVGAGPVAIGPALVAAKQIYLAQTPQLRALHEKSLLEATIFGLPMLKIDMPGTPLTPPADGSIVGGLDQFDTDPGSTLDLQFADLQINPSLTEVPVNLTDITDDETVPTIYLQGSDGVLTNPGEPALPLELKNVSGPGNLALRGVGFRGGSYSDTPNKNALVGAPTTEIRSVHLPFSSDIFYPIQPWSVNYFDALANSGGVTRLAVTPAQYKSTTPGDITNTLRQFGSMNFRLYYSNNTDTPALSAAPVIANVSAPLIEGGTSFKIKVIGDPAAGIQEVWVTYTTVCPVNTACNRTWQTLDLTQNLEDSTLWEAELLTGSPGDIRYIVQAANGVGLVSLATNLGAFYIPGVDEVDLSPTALSLDSPEATSGPYGTDATFSATLTDVDGEPLADKVVIFGLGAQNGVGVTNEDGEASVTLPLLGLPGEYEVRAVFPGTPTEAPSTALDTFEFDITKQNTSLCLEPPAGATDNACQSQPISVSGIATNKALLVATLTDASGQRLFEKTVVFVVTGSGGNYSEAVITDYAGRARLGQLPLPPGSYTVKAYFLGSITLGTGQTITLDDPRYNPSNRKGYLTLQNSAPAAVNDAYQVDEDNVLQVAAPGVLSNDTDADQATLTAVLVTGPAKGSLTLNANGSFTYTPKPNFHGTDTFTYKANDGSQNSNVATVTITINPVNDAPVATKDVYYTNQEQKLVVAAPGVLANDSDIDSAPLTAVLVSNPGHGSVTLQSSGAFTYTPAYGFHGTDSFTYKANDGSQNSNVATVTITVKPKPQGCIGATPYPAIIWQPNKNFKSITIQNVGEWAQVTITSIFQDEPVGKGTHSPDGQGIGTSTAKIRAERDGTGNGRVYHIGFNVSDKKGNFCSGLVRVAVPHNQGSDLNIIDGGPLHNSTQKGY